jgi:uncharacterized membrane protein YdjX (TVP38/TMEM64 family)
MRKKSLALVLLLLLLLAVLVFNSDLSGEFRAYVHWLMEQARQDRYTFIIVFALLQTLSCLSGIIPASVVAIACGAVYGILSGSIISIAGLFLAAITGFWISRFMFRHRIETVISRQDGWAKVDRLVTDYGWKGVLLIRLSPVAPFGISTYLMGLTGISMSQFLLGTTGALPALFAYVYTGVLAEAVISIPNSAHGELDLFRWGLILTGFAATLALLVFVSRLARQAMASGKAQGEVP